jgi:hypothetical protein
MGRCVKMIGMTEARDQAMDIQGILETDPNSKELGSEIKLDAFLGLHFVLLRKRFLDAVTCVHCKKEESYFIEYRKYPGEEIWKWYLTNSADDMSKM